MVSSVLVPLSIAGLPLPPFESATELLVFFVALTVVSHGAVIVYINYFSPTLSTDDGVAVGSEWRFDPVADDVPDDD